MWARGYSGTGGLSDPIVFCEHVSYFVGLRQYCAQHGLDPQQRESLSVSSPDGDTLLDRVAGHVYFRVPPPGDYDPPLGWTLMGDEAVGHVVWRGGTDVTVSAGSELTRLVLQALAPALAEAAPAIPLDITMAMLRQSTGGAIYAVKLPRDQIPERTREPYQSNTWSFSLEPAALLTATQAGDVVWQRSGDAFKAGGALPSGEECWVQVFRHDSRFVLTVTGALDVPPRIVRQGRGFLWRSPLAKLHELLSVR